MTTADPIRVLTVDDHPVLREGIAAILEAQPDIQLAGEAGNGKEAIELFRKLKPDVTLMDLQMPEMSGVEAIAAQSFDGDDLERRPTKGCVPLVAGDIGAGFEASFLFEHRKIGLDSRRFLLGGEAGP